MSDFTDKEDQVLIRFAVREKARGNSRIPWGKIAKLMRSKKRPEQLRLRVVCLKKRFGADLTKFPPRYFCTSKSVLELKGPKTRSRTRDEKLNEGDESLISLLALLDDDMDHCRKRQPISRLLPPSTLQRLLSPQVDSDSPPQLIQRKQGLNRRHKTSYKTTTLHLSSIDEQLDMM